MPLPQTLMPLERQYRILPQDTYSKVLKDHLISFWVVYPYFFSFLAFNNFHIAKSVMLTETAISGLSIESLRQHTDISVDYGVYLPPREGDSRVVEGANPYYLVSTKSLHLTAARSDRERSPYGFRLRPAAVILSVVRSAESKFCVSKIAVGEISAGLRSR